MSRLCLCLSLLLSLPSYAKPTNILFILTDNQPASILGAYGNPEVRTPHIDQLAREGLKFNNAFSVNGMCSPTRATLMTGLMPSQHGVHNWLDDEEMKHWPKTWSAIAELRTLPLTLKNRGYKTALIGKWHLGQPWKASIGYEHWLTFTDGHTVDFWNNTIVDNGKQYRVEGQHVVDFFTEKAIDFIASQNGEKPFYLQLNYDGPYLNPPTNAGPAKNRHYKSYLNSEFSSFPRVAFNANVARQLTDPETPKFLQRMQLAAISMHNDRETMANVASQNSIVDDGVGKVMAALKAKGLDHNTLVVFSSDQGNFYGQHGLWEHNTVTKPANLYEAALNIPLIIRQPGTIPSGEKDELIAQYDLPVTILDYLKISDVGFENSPGRSFSELLQGRMFTGSSEVFYEQEETRGIRTPQFAYWKRLKSTGSAALFDMKADPQQNYNLIGSPQYQQDVARLNQKLEQFFERYSSPKYDLWRAGVAKGSVMRPRVFKGIYGEHWQTETKVLPEFKE